MRKETLKIKKTNTGFDDEMAKETKQEKTRDLHITGKRKNLHSPGKKQKAKGSEGKGHKAIQMLVLGFL